MVTRKQYLAITGLDRDQHTALKRRDQIPFPTDGHNEYSFFDAFTFLLADGFASRDAGVGVDRNQAAHIVRHAGRLLAERGSDIEANSGFDWTSEKVIHVGRLSAGRNRVPFVGTIGELHDELARLAPLTGMTLLNASAAFAVLVARERRAGAEFPDDWPDPSTIPSSEELTEQEGRFLRDAMERTLADRETGE